MKTTGFSFDLEARRRLAVTRVNEGWMQKDVAAFLGVSLKAVGKWMAAYRAWGDDGLKGKPHPGPKPKLSKRQEAGVLACLAKSPKAFGYATDLWTTRRLAEVIEKKFGIRFNANYLAAWLARRSYSPQKPVTTAVERDNPAIARWAAEEWPGLKKKPGKSGRTSS
jgi:transposase